MKMETKMKNKYQCHKKSIICKTCGKRVPCTSSRQLYCKKCGAINTKQYIKQYICTYRTTKKGNANIKKAVYKQRTKINSEYITETFTMSQWFSKLDRTKGICPMCNKFVGKDKLTIDHIYPISKAEKGRIYTIRDVQPLCKACNSKKGNKC